MTEKQPKPQAPKETPPATKDLAERLWNDPSISPQEAKEILDRARREDEEGTPDTDDDLV